MKLEIGSIIRYDHQFFRDDPTDKVTRTILVLKEPRRNSKLNIYRGYCYELDDVIPFMVLPHELHNLQILD